jgi:hypothetical protein
MTRLTRASGRHITSPRCESVPMVSDSTQEHDGTHDRHETSRAADERSKGSARRQPRACAERARRGPRRRARRPQKCGTTWRRRLRSGPRRRAQIPGPCAIRRRVTAVGWAPNSTGRRSRFAHGSSRADDRSTRRWLPERVLRGLQSWRCAHGSSSLAVAAIGDQSRGARQGSTAIGSSAGRRPTPSATRDLSLRHAVAAIAAALDGQWRTRRSA